MTIEQANTFYYMGRNSVWNGDRRAKFEDVEAQRNYDQGRRDARAEERLNADTEWDDD